MPEYILFGRVGRWFCLATEIENAMTKPLFRLEGLHCVPGRRSWNRNRRKDLDRSIQDGLTTSVISEMLFIVRLFLGIALSMQ